MRRNRKSLQAIPLVTGAALLLFVAQVFWVKPSVPPIVNMHESVESEAAAQNILEGMEALGIRTTVLAAIPNELLYFSGDEASIKDVEFGNELVHQLAELHPEFDFMCTLDVLDMDRERVLRDCLEAGAVGLKLYNGYSYSHVLPLDDPRLNDVYGLLQETGTPLLLPVNAGEFRAELENLLSAFPDLKVVCAHYCLSSKSPERLSELMRLHPNLYVDTSFGSTAYAMEGFQTIRDNHEEFLEFFTNFQDRIVFGTDNVITSYEAKDAHFLEELYRDYITVLTEDLALPYAIQQKVFWKNWADLLE